MGDRENEHRAESKDLHLNGVRCHVFVRKASKAGSTTMIAAQQGQSEDGRRLYIRKDGKCAKSLQARMERGISGQKQRRGDVSLSVEKG